MRKPVSKSVRFEVFKRDSFKCQYCGRSAPDILLEIDHIDPVSNCGTNDVMNLLTACKDCNSGKSDRLLSDTSVVEKRRRQLEDLQERQEQNRMMLDWQTTLVDIRQDAAAEIAAIWSRHVPGFELSESGIRDLRKLLRTFSVTEILRAIEFTADKHLVWEDGKPTNASAGVAFKQIFPVCKMNRLREENPELSRLHYIRGILRRRFPKNCDCAYALTLLKRVQALGADINALEDYAKSYPTWDSYRKCLEEFVWKYQPPPPEVNQ